MKALELADEIEMQFPKGSHHRQEIEAAAAELRRIAEVNAELLKAINALTVTAESTKPGEFSVAGYALLALQAAANKAKEAQ